MPSAGSRPLIGVSMYRQVSAWWAWERDAALVPGCYLDVVHEAGGQPLLIPPPAPAAAGIPGVFGSAVAELVGVLDALVLIGGGDIDADRYGQTADSRNGGTNDQRDDLEFGLLDRGTGSRPTGAGHLPWNAGAQRVPRW